MSMDAERNSALRFHGWNVFRSSSRDHMIPSVSPGRVLQRIRIAEAFPVRGVEEGAEAASLDLRAQIAAAGAERRSRVTGAEDIPLGQMQYIPALLRNTVATINNVAVDEEFVIGIAPYDGYITEFIANRNASDFGGQRVAIRTSSGGTMFRSFDNNVGVTPSPFMEPDFIPFDYAGTGIFGPELRRGKVAVFAGDQIIAVLRNTLAGAVGAARLFVTVGIEAVVLGSAGSRASLSAFSASAAQQAKANRDAAAAADRLAIERERTRRLELEIQGKIALADKLGAKSKAESRKAPEPPPAPYKDTPFTPTDGAGKTFVSAWIPNENSIGYLIPTPPRGGKVNTFGDEYSVFDITGKLIDRGKVELVRSQDQIPPASRLSSNIRTTLSPDTRQSQADILATRRGESAFG